MQFWRETTVYTQELFVHDSGEGEVAERVHDCIVDGVGVFVLACRESTCDLDTFYGPGS